MKITNEMIDCAIAAYATKRHPSRWDGEPWGEAGRINHRKAIEAALKAVIMPQKQHITRNI